MARNRELRDGDVIRVVSLTGPGAEFTQHAVPVSIMRERQLGMGHAPKVYEASDAEEPSVAVYQSPLGQAVLVVGPSDGGLSAAPPQSLTGGEIPSARQIGLSEFGAEVLNSIHRLGELSVPEVLLKDAGAFRRAAQDVRSSCGSLEKTVELALELQAVVIYAIDLQLTDVPAVERLMGIDGPPEAIKDDAGMSWSAWKTLRQHPLVDPDYPTDGRPWERVEGLATDYVVWTAAVIMRLTRVGHLSRHSS